MRNRDAFQRVLAASYNALLEKRQIGLVHLDPRGKILAANDRAQRLLRRGNGLSARKGRLEARNSDDQSRLDRLVAAALLTRRRGRRQWVDGARPFDRVAAAGGACQTRGGLRTRATAHGPWPRWSCWSSRGAPFGSPPPR